MTRTVPANIRIPERVWAAVDDARWVRWDRHRQRIFIWRGDEKVWIVGELDAEPQGSWLLPPGVEPSMPAVEAVIAERINQGH